MLGGLALKRRWQHKRRAEGKPADRPNMVMGINVQVCWERNPWPRFPVDHSIPGTERSTWPSKMLPACRK